MQYQGKQGRNRWTIKYTYYLVKAKMKFMFDTNAFNNILDESFEVHRKQGQEYFIINLQCAEINKTKNEQRRKNLISMFSVVNAATDASEIDQHSTPWDSPWDSPWDKGGQYYKPIFDALEKRKPKDRGSSYDAVMIETCKYEDITFVSDDSAVLEVSKEFGVKCVKLSDFMAS